MSVDFVSNSVLPTEFGTFKIFAFEDSETGHCHLAITTEQYPLAQTNTEQPTLLRIHSECLTGDALFSQRCDCGSQLRLAYQNIAENGTGVILYLRQEGRGIGLANKVKAYQLQDAGADTVEANEHLGFDADLRDYGICKPMLDYLNISKVALMTNNLNKVEALEAIGVEVTERLSHQQGKNDYNRQYLKTKVEKLGHQINLS